MISLCLSLRNSFCAVFVLVALILGGCRSASEFSSEPERLVENSRITFRGMVADNQFPGLLDLATRAKAIIIAPSMIRVAFGIGGRGGNAVMLVRDINGVWSDPGFYTIGGGSLGLQLGGDASEVVIVVMTEKGFQALLQREVTLGGEVGVAAGELGQGLRAGTGMGLKADMYTFARAQGLYVGVSLDGAVVAPRKLWNEQFYGAGTTPEKIFLARSVTPVAPDAVRDLKAVMP